jgi:signal transduction histidine kinase
LLLPIFQDGSGQTRIPPKVAADVARVSPAPVYSAVATLFGHGIVGGYLDNFETQGVAAADLALEILTGKDPSALPRRTSTLHRYEVDARQLRHWRLSENNIPDDGAVLFKEPTLWDRHRGFVITTIGAIIFQSAALIALLIQGRRRRQAELALGSSEARLLTLREDEHKRIAEELHDSTVQHLAAAELNLTNLEMSLQRGVDVTDVIRETQTSLHEATKELRSFSYLLHPMQLETDGLASSVQRYVDGFARRTRLRASVRIKGDIDALPATLQLALLRVVQEALTNVHRHASASRVIVNLRRRGRRVHLVVSDDGKGISSRSQSKVVKPPNLGVGIPGMKARVGQFGGALDIRSRSRGTTIHVVVPV